MSNSNSTDTSKTGTDTSKPTGQAPFVKQGESQNDAKPKVEDPKPNTDVDRQATTGESKQPATDDSAGKSLR